MDYTLYHYTLTDQWSVHRWHVAPCMVLWYRSKSFDHAWTRPCSTFSCRNLIGWRILHCIIHLTHVVLYLIHMIKIKFICFILQAPCFFEHSNTIAPILPHATCWRIAHYKPVWPSFSLRWFMDSIMHNAVLIAEKNLTRLRVYIDQIRWILGAFSSSFWQFDRNPAKNRQIMPLSHTIYLAGITL